METLKEQVEKEVENETAQFRLRTVKKYIPTFTAKSICRDVVSKAWADNEGYRYRYTIKIGKSGGRQFTFMFYDSIYAYKTNAKLNIFDAIYSMISDCNAYQDANNFEDFVAKFGYDTDNKEQLAKAKRAFYGCRSIYMKATCVFSSDELEILEGACSQY